MTNTTDILSERYQESIERKMDADTINLKDLNSTIVAFCRLTQLNYFKIQEIGSSIIDINREIKRFSDDIKKIGGTSADEQKEILLTFVDDIAFGLQTRTSNCLKWANIQLVGELIEKTEKELRYIPNLGRKMLREIKSCLERNNLYLKDS